MKWLKCSYVVLALCPCRDQGKAGCFGTDCPSNIPVFPYFLFCDMCLQSFAVSVASIGRSRYCRRRPATIREVYLSCIRPFMWVIAGRHAPPPRKQGYNTAFSCASMFKMFKLSLVVEKSGWSSEFSGNSGGPVLGAHGLVVGMACSHLKNVPALSDAEVRHQIWVVFLHFGFRLTWLVWLFWVFHPFEWEFNSFLFSLYFVWRERAEIWSHNVCSCFMLCLSLSVFLWKGRLMLPAPLSSAHAVLLCHCFFCLVGPWMPTIWSRYRKPCHCHLVTNI